jgi:hypothetical protein
MYALMQDVSTAQASDEANARSAETQRCVLSILSYAKRARRDAAAENFAFST